MVSVGWKCSNCDEYNCSRNFVAEIETAKFFSVFKLRREIYELTEKVNDKERLISSIEQVAIWVDKCMGSRIARGKEMVKVS